MRSLVPPLCLALAAALAGCGSGSGATTPAGRAAARTPAGPAPATTLAAPSPTVTQRSPAQAAAAQAAAAPTATTAPTTTAPASTTATAAAPASTTAPTSTTPQSLPPPKRRRGPRRISVAESSRPISPAGGRSAAQQLVEAWRRGPVPASDPDVALVQRHLDSLAGKCSETEADIAGYIRAGIERYRTHGVLESPVEFARALDSATPPGRSNCKAILRVLLAQVEQG